MSERSRQDGAMETVKRTGKALLQPLIAIAAGLIVGAIIIAITGNNPLEVYAILLKGGFGDPYYFLTTLSRATPIIFGAISAALCWQSGYFNIGGEGQMIAGAFVSAVVAIYLPVPGILRMLIAIVLAMLAGGAMSWFAGWLESKFGVLMVISTLMMNYIASYWTWYAVSFPLKDKSIDGIVAQSYTVEVGRMTPIELPMFGPGVTLHVGFIIAVVFILLMYFVMKRTTFGYEARMGGLNPFFAVYGGVKRNKNMYLLMLIAGAVAAMGGVTEVLGLKYRYIHEMISSPSYAWTGLMAALISNYHPIGMLFSSIFLAGLQTGASALQRAQHINIPLEIASVIQGLITLFVSAKFIAMLPAVQKWRKRKGSPPEAPVVEAASEEGGEAS